MSSELGARRDARDCPPLVDHPLVYESVLDLVGDTPLVKLSNLLSTPAARPRSKVTAATGAQLWGKLENFNPAGSLKDRISLAVGAAVAICAMLAT